MLAGSVVVLGESRIEVHQCFEGEKFLANWFVFIGPTRPFDNEASVARERHSSSKRWPRISFCSIRILLSLSSGRTRWLNPGYKLFGDTSGNKARM
jgi:hypothetical protein